ncbi:Hypothetical protein GbCGDNIH2_0353 [Granulibacter bethesdensis]|nr:Hypothetical protein GbCGDNIH2_0353 [Granulibacter bethesdensis]
MAQHAGSAAGITLMATPRILSWPAAGDPRFWLSAGAVFLLVLAVILPRVYHTGPSYRMVAVVDITGSMNTRDQMLNGQVVSRLDKVRHDLSDFVGRLPCGSQFGLAIFTERRPYLVVEPVETCANFPALDDEITHLDWRMAWEGDSHITEGLYRSIVLAHDLNADLMFMTDGQEAPPLPWTGPPPFDGKKNIVKGLIVGVGGLTPTPIPKYDDHGRQVGFWRPQDIPAENEAAPPPPDAENREGYNPRNAPFGNVGGNASGSLSAVDEKHLQSLGTITGLDYFHLGTGDLNGVAEKRMTKRPVRQLVEISWIPALLSLVALGLCYLVLPVLGVAAVWRSRAQARRRLEDRNAGRDSNKASSVAVNPAPTALYRA